MNASLAIITEKHSESARELFEHLDCRSDEKGLRILDELLEYTTMLVVVLNDLKREQNGNDNEPVRRAQSSRTA